MQGKIRRLSLLLLLAWMLPNLLRLPTGASSTHLATSVPTHVSLTVEITGKGTVLVGDEEITKTTSLPVLRNRDCALSVSPASGYLLERVFLDGKDITRALSDGNLILEETGQDIVLSVTFLKRGADATNPKTGDMAVIPTTEISLFAAVALWFVIREWKVTKQKW